MALGSMALAPVTAVHSAVSYTEAVRMYRTGDYTDGAMALQALAESGDARAQYFLGSALLTGSQGIPVDRAQGYAWMQIAATDYWGASGFSAIDDAKNAELEVGPKLSGSELLRAEQISSAYLVKKKQHFDEQWDDAYEVLMGRKSGGNRVRLTGCAIDRSLPRCGSNDLADTGNPPCAGGIVKPDVPPNSAGPLARSSRVTYPQAEAGKHAEGSVVYVAHVDRSGFVCHVVQVLGSGSDAMDRAAMQSLRTRRFQPGVKDGQAVESIHTQQVIFGISEYRP